MNPYRPPLLNPNPAILDDSDSIDVNLYDFRVMNRFKDSGYGFTNVWITGEYKEMTEDEVIYAILSWEYSHGS